MEALILMILYGYASFSGAVLVVFSLLRIQYRLSLGQLPSVAVLAVIGLLGVIGMVKHFSSARQYWYSWRDYQPMG